jgi:hypothetical protein
VSRKYDIPGDEIWARLANGVLQRARDGKSSAYAQAKAQYAAVQFPQPVLEPVSTTQSFETSPGDGHLRLM